MFNKKLFRRLLKELIEMHATPVGYGDEGEPYTPFQYAVAVLEIFAVVAAFGIAVATANR